MTTTPFCVVAASASSGAAVSGKAFDEKLEYASAGLGDSYLYGRPDGAQRERNT
jgi:hypothetical protein